MSKLISCVECKHEFLLESVNIQEQKVKCENEELLLTFFTCPKCNKIYRVLLKDARYEELKVDLEKTKGRIRRNHGSNNNEWASVLNTMVNKKADRLKRHVDKLMHKYDGTFTFVVSEETNTKELKYLP